jgi:hypothetical protein
MWNTKRSLCDRVTGADSGSHGQLQWAGKFFHCPVAWWRVCAQQRHARDSLARHFRCQNHLRKFHSVSAVYKSRRDSVMHGFDPQARS